MPKTFDVTVAGYFDGRLGQGEAARDFVVSLRAAGASVAAVEPVALQPERSGVDFPTDRLADVYAPVTLLCLHPPALRELAATGRLPSGDRRIGLWFWELVELRPDWVDALQYLELDELWVTCDLALHAVAQHAGVPVVKVPYPVREPPPSGRADLPFTLPDGYRFLFAFDYLSTIARKNPIGLIDAFTAAFAVDDGVSLVLKTANARMAPRQHVEVARIAARHPHVHLVDRWVSGEEWDALLRAIDCYVSLHRSEAFGLTVAEAMLRSKPVVATRYGGVLEFATPENAFLVDWQPTRVGPGVPSYPADGEWAEPDHDHAVETLRRVVADPVEASARGRRGGADIRRRFAPAAVGAHLRALVEEHRAPPTPQRPPLSVVVATTFAWPAVRDTLAVLRPQVHRTRAELIVVDGHGQGVPSADSSDAQVVRAPGEDVFTLRMIGRQHAQGELVAYIEDHCLPTPDWCEKIVAAHAAHRHAAGVVGGVQNGATATLADRANFLATFAMFHPPLDVLPTDRVPPFASVSFRRDALAGLPSEAGALEVGLFPRLHAEGRLVPGAGVAVEHRQTHGGLMRTLMAHFHNGRAIGGYFRGHLSRHDLYARLKWCALLPAHMMLQTRDAVRANPGQHASVLDLLMVAVLGACHGLGHALGLALGPGRSAHKLA